MNKIKRCVSLYSYQDAYAMQRMSLDDIFAELKHLEVDGFEFISDQMMHNTPFPDGQTLKEWDRLMDSYGISRVCNDIFINTKLYTTRSLTHEECVSSLKNEIVLAKRLGFPMIRMVCGTPWEIIMPVMDFAAQTNVVMAFEIHGGLGFNTEPTQKQLAEVKRINSPYLGLVIDTSLFVQRFPRKIRQMAKNFGVTEEVLKYIDRMYIDGRNPIDEFAKGIPADLTPLMKNPADGFIPVLSRSYENNPLTILEEWMPFVKHVHGKLLEMNLDGTADGTDFDAVITYLNSKAYEGHIATEYEGQRYRKSNELSDEVEVVRAHQKLLKQSIEKLPR